MYFHYLLLVKHPANRLSSLLAPYDKILKLLEIRRQQNFCGSQLGEPLICNLSDQSPGSDIGEVLGRNHVRLDLSSLQCLPAHLLPLVFGMSLSYSSSLPFNFLPGADQAHRVLTIVVLSKQRQDGFRFSPFIEIGNKLHVATHNSQTPLHRWQAPGAVPDSPNVSEEP